MTEWHLQNGTEACVENGTQNIKIGMDENTYKLQKQSTSLKKMAYVDNKRPCSLQ